MLWKGIAPAAHDQLGLLPHFVVNVHFRRRRTIDPNWEGLSRVWAINVNISAHFRQSVRHSFQLNEKHIVHALFAKAQWCELQSMVVLRKGFEEGIVDIFFRVLRSVFDGHLVPCEAGSGRGASVAKISAHHQIRRNDVRSTATSWPAWIFAANISAGSWKSSTKTTFIRKLNYRFNMNTRIITHHEQLINLRKRSGSSWLYTPIMMTYVIIISFDDDSHGRPGSSESTPDPSFTDSSASTITVERDSFVIRGILDQRKTFASFKHAV